ncbi:ER membrane protein complex subunit [Acrasis kona]|uniref:ER membrane protein complex subunit 10 n=1 Tax=Acrasis kona TaxID=1008807 RepID=A0AAW2Z2G4_9EUKA
MTFKVLVVFVLSVLVTFCFSQESKPVYNVEQSFDGGKIWSKRGSLNSVGLNRRLTYIPDGPWQIPSDAYTTTGNSLYQIRFASVEGNQSPIMTSVSFCDVIRSQLHELFTLHIDQTTHKLTSVDYIVTVGHSTSPFINRTCSVPDQLRKGNTKQQVRITIPSPVQGDKVSFVGVKTPDQKKKEEEQQNEPGFFRKYWYFIVPGVLMLLVSSFTAPEEGGQAAAQ